MPFPESNHVGPTEPPATHSGLQRFYRYPVIGRALKFLTWWLIFAGIYASSSVCPFCGRLGCPVGGASAGLVGGLFALAIGKGKVIIDRVIRGFSRLRAALKSTREGRL
jgi:hypothetical protein